MKISLRAARTNARLTIEQASEKIGVSKKTLIKWEYNPGLVTPIRQRKIEEVYNFPKENIDFS